MSRAALPISLALFIPLLLPPALADAQETPSPAHADTAAATAPKRAAAMRIDGRAPALDGRLDDGAWAAAPVLTGFWQKEPREGTPATERTEVRFVYDDRALYVGARMASGEPGRIQAPVSRRDVTDAAEFIAISLDTYHDRRTAYTFGVTAAGTRTDLYHPRDSDDGDTQFDPVWEARVARDSAGWTAEMRIPLSQLRFNPGDAQAWGLNVRRWMPQKEEDDYWIVVPKSVSAWASRFGELDGIAGVRPGRRVELSPYVATGASFSQGVDAADPFHSPREETVRAGADLKLGLGPNLTLDATVNPDFGQVEADPAEVNLSAFETFFSEKRPFFTEGSGLLSGGGAGYFYSRRIGAAPHGLADGDFVDRPSNSTILGAAKLTGRLPSGLSVGVLGAVTARERARTFDAETGEFGRVEVEPPTGYGVVRLQQELGKTGSTAGVILTGVHRGIGDGSPLAARLDRDALTGAADWDLRLGGGTYEVTGALGFSHVAGDSLAILRIQRSSARYLQRPDADYVTYDPSLTTLSGYTASLAAQKISGRHWLWTVAGDLRSAGFELNDAGSQSSADFRQVYGELRYRETTPRGPFRRWATYVTPVAQWNGGGVMTDGELWFDAEATLKNFWRTTFTAFRTFPVQSQTLTRGGPLAGAPGSWAMIGLLQNSAAARLQWRGRVYYGMNDQRAVTYRLSGRLSVRPAPRWQLSVEPNYLRYTSTRQYVATFDGGPAATFGRTYVFAAVDRSEFLADFRLTYLFTPDLSLELYAEPFASSGRYHDFGDLPAARAFALRPLDGDTTRVLRTGTSTEVRFDGQSRTVDDFNVRSFRSNAVLRWEWRPGSTLYLVWQQDRSGDRDRIAHVGPRSLLETLDAPGDNFLALKVTYWLPLR
ncbi:DUF5916 domain-containing protein [Longimicrobium sp.]|uniref:DUF5916 domain-containing protein n=1 Tax=Longimicrobium sp. TaxID=2029185 RepID=UPI002C2A7D2E|nr:DUF5916 domain-containing protein [Longimicrobium sp.]HSU15786.1 DUF5916 domain-containing protein [Longimicrobium sp.]